MGLLKTATRDVRTGRFERTLSALTAAGAAVTAGEIYFSHDGASFGNKMMWWPVVVLPAAVPAGIAGAVSRRAAKTVLPVCSAAIVANGLQGIAVDTAEDVGPAWDAAFATDRPTVLDVRTDPDVPPIPPHATFEQVKATTSAVLHGDEDSAGFVKQGIKQKVQQYLPGTKDGE